MHCCFTEKINIRFYYITGKKSDIFAAFQKYELKRLENSGIADITNGRNTF